jgi:hypothetical protein
MGGKGDAFEFAVLRQHLSRSNSGLARALTRGKGAVDKSREIARKLLEHGVAWEVVSEATGVLPEDLEAAKA